MKVELSNYEKLFVLNDVLMDLCDESVIDEFEFGKLLGSYRAVKGITLGIQDKKELGL